MGVDLTAGVRPVDVAALDPSGRSVAFRQVRSDDELCGVLQELGAEVVAVDSPMDLPSGLCCLEEDCSCVPSGPGTGRSAERALAALGIPCFWTTKRTIIKKMVYRAIALKERLEASGYTVLEVYPYAVKRILFGRHLPRKSRPEGIAFLIDGAKSELPSCAWPALWAPSHD